MAIVKKTIVKGQKLTKKQLMELEAVSKMPIIYDGDSIKNEILMPMDLCSMGIVFNITSTRSGEAIFRIFLLIKRRMASYALSYTVSK